MVPAHNEQGCIQIVAQALILELERNAIEYELIIVNDNSTDDTSLILKEISGRHNKVVIIDSDSPKGFGWAIRKGLESVSADIVVIYMGDGSDDPQDVVKYYNKILEGYDCVFGSRFIKGSKTSGYPKIKLILNRMGNFLIQILFFMQYNDVSNAFKAYRIEAIKSMQPLVSQYFNITVEMPLKAIIAGFSYAVIPINWSGRGSGVSKYHIRELSRKYFFSIFLASLPCIFITFSVYSLFFSYPAKGPLTPEISADTA